MIWYGHALDIKYFQTYSVSVYGYVLQGCMSPKGTMGLEYACGCTSLEWIAGSEATPK